MTIHEIGYHKYNIFCNIDNREILIATIRPPLIGTHVIFVTFCFPFDECHEKTIDMNKYTTREMLEIATNMIRTHLYKISQQLLSASQSVEHIDKYDRNAIDIRNHLRHGDVYGR